MGLGSDAIWRHCGGMEIDADIITFNIDPQVFWGLVTLAVFGGIVGLTLALTTLVGPEKNWLTQVKNSLGLKDFNSGLFLIGASIWSVVFLLLTVGLIGLIWNLIWNALPVDDKAIWDWRFALAKLTALTATLGVVVALPITMQRLRLTRQQINLTAEALFNDKINAAADDLHARRLVTKNPDEKDNRWDYWQDDIVRRNAAIDRLEGLAIERPDIAPRIARMLGIYVRELSAENKPQKVPETASPQELRKWARSLADHRRSDMENAAQTLGRLQRINGVEPIKVEIDLRGANLQGFDLRELAFDKARLQWAQMQGADLSWAQMQAAGLRGAQMQGAHLIEAKMQGADLSEAQMQEADLSGAQMQGADLFGAQMQWADLRLAQMDSATSFDAVHLRGAALLNGDYTDVPFSQPQVDSVFYDGSVTFSPDIKRAAGREAVLDWDDFYGHWQEWQEWQDSIGFAPETPED